VSNYERWDWMLVNSVTVTYPTGKGGTTTVAANGLARVGTRVILHSIRCLNTAGGVASATNGAGTTYAPSGPTLTFINVASTAHSGQTLDIELFDGLGWVSTAADGVWLVTFRVLGPAAAP
jgi:hypothetical protein